MGKNYVESSLKRFLKRKVKITMGFVVAFMITGNIAIGKQLVVNSGKPVDDITSPNFNLSFDYDGHASGIFISEEGSSLNIFSDNIIVNRTGNVIVNSNQVEGIKVQNGGKLNLGSKNTENISITSTTDKGLAIGLSSLAMGSEVMVNSKNLNINVHSGEYYAYGISVQNNTTNETDVNKMAKMVINSENTVIKVTSGVKIDPQDKDNHAVGITVFSQGRLEINGNLEIEADTVLGTRGDSLTKINQNKRNTVKLTGDINFNYHNTTPVDAGVFIDLSNEESFFKGKIAVTGNNIPDGYEKVLNMNLGLSNGGTWEVTGDSFVNDLTMNGGVLEVTDAVKDINVDRLHGNSGIAMFAASVEGDNIEVTGGKVTVGEVTGNTDLKVGFSGVNADDLVGTGAVAESFKKLQNKVEITAGKDKVEETYFAEEGKVSGEITAKDDGKGGLVITQEKESKTVMGLKDLATINYLSWKQEMGSLTQRMGELRDSSAEHGVWARVYGGKVENGSQYDNEYQTYQVGYDKKYIVDNGRVYFGYLVSYTDGETDYALGHGENYSVGAGIYATWMNNNGHYADVLYKVSRLNNKFDVNSINDQVGKSSGKYDTFGISLSAEYGKRFDLGEKWFAEPSIGMHLGQLGDETYTTNSGIEVSQDSIYTAEGRVGTAIGYKFNDKGNVYARTHVVKEFAGDIDAEYKAEGVTNKTSEDMGDTWLEFGVGVNYRFAENVNVYADVEKTGDSTVDTKWQANLGFRYEF